MTISLVGVIVGAEVIVIPVTTVVVTVTVAVVVRGSYLRSIRFASLNGGCSCLLANHSRCKLCNNGNTVSNIKSWGNQVSVFPPLQVVKGLKRLVVVAVLVTEVPGLEAIAATIVWLCG